MKSHGSGTLDKTKQQKIGKDQETWRCSREGSSHWYFSRLISREVFTSALAIRLIDSNDISNLSYRFVSDTNLWPFRMYAQYAHVAIIPGIIICLDTFHERDLIKSLSYDVRVNSPYSRLFFTFCINAFVSFTWVRHEELTWLPSTSLVWSIRY